MNPAGGEVEDSMFFTISMLADISTRPLYFNLLALILFSHNYDANPFCVPSPVNGWLCIISKNCWQLGRLGDSLALN